MADLTLDGLDIKESTKDGIQLDLVSGFYEPPVFRGSDTIVPGAGGRVVRNRVEDVRRIILEGYVTGTSAADWATNTNSLMLTLYGSASGDPVNLVVTAPYLGTAAGPYTIAVRFVNAVGGDPMYAVKYQRWSIELEAVSPDWS